MFYLYSARAARGFGDGFAALILPAYLSALGFGPVQIGIVAAAALLGSAVLTLAIGLIAPRYDLRTLLLACAGLMIATGIAFLASAHFVFIALVAFIGTINPTTGDIGVHVPLEQAAVDFLFLDQVEGVAQWTWDEIAQFLAEVKSDVLKFGYLKDYMKLLEEDPGGDG